jgi:hypothetical protein
LMVDVDRWVVQTALTALGSAQLAALGTAQIVALGTDGVQALALTALSGLGTAQAASPVWLARAMPSGRMRFSDTTPGAGPRLGTG